MGGNVNMGTGGVFQWNVGNLPPGGAAVGNNQPAFTDKLSSLGNLSYLQEYVFNTNNPHLPNPEQYAATTFDSEQLLNNVLTADFQDAPPISARSEQKKSYNTEFQNRLLSLVNDEGFLKENGNLTPEQAENKLKLALLFPNQETDSKILLALKGLEDGFPESWPGASDLNEFKGDLGIVKDNAFEKALANLIDKATNPQDVIALKNAYYNGNTEGLTKEQAAIFQNVMQTAQNNLSTKWGIPADADVPPAGKEYFNASMNVNFTDQFKGNLYDQLANGTISKEQYNVLIASYYFPDSSDPQQAALKGKFDEVMNQTLQNFTQESGLPSDWKPSPSQEVGQAHADGAWRDAFAANLAKLGLPVDQQMALLKALENPSAASPIIKTLLETLVQQTTAEVIENLNLPPNWNPKNKVVKSAVDPVSLGVMRNGISLLSDIKKAGEEMLKNMAPDDPDRAILLDYLKTVGKNLNDLQEALYQVEVSLSKAGKTLNAAVLDMQLNKIAEAKKQAAEEKAARNAGKGGKHQSDSKKTFMKVFMPIMSVMMLVMAVVTGNPLLISLALFMLSNSLSQAAGGPDIMQKSFEVLDTVLSAIFPDSKFGMFMRSMVKALLVLVVVALCLVGGGMTGIMIASTFLMEGLTKSGMMSDFVKGVCGGSDKDVMWASMAVMIAVMVLTIVITIVLSVASGVVSFIMPASTVGVVSAQIANITSQITSLLTRIMQMISQMGQMAARIVQFVQKVVQILRNILQFVRDIPNMVSKFVADTLKTCLEKIKDIAQKIVDNLKTLINQAANKGSSIAKKTQDIAKEVREFTKQIQKIFDKMKDFLKLDKIYQGFQKSSTKDKLEMVGELVQSGASIGTGTSNMIEGINQAKLDFLLAEIAKKVAASQSYIEEIGAIIKLLKAAIQALLESMGGVADFIKEVNALQSKKFQDASSGQGWLALQSTS